MSLLTYGRMSGVTVAVAVVLAGGELFIGLGLSFLLGWPGCWWFCFSKGCCIFAVLAVAFLFHPSVCWAGGISLGHLSVPLVPVPPSFVGTQRAGMPVEGSQGAGSQGKHFASQSFPPERSPCLHPRRKKTTSWVLVPPLGYRYLDLGV
ncbi:hypothetical protein XENORESO_021162 [Xenotaenia resolanae]|uniref:Uncharacterized protein n=1 Tax=Xenotaenia resolanae TaxID=208358 RepID=A0ABV0WPM4_9TELE